jgi:hypothetical protein
MTEIKYYLNSEPEPDKIDDLITDEEEDEEKITDCD